MAKRVDFFGRVDGKARTPQGGLRVSANLTRTGIFLYQDAQGATVREYRPPAEVFKADSLETLKLAPLTIGHPDFVRTDNYKHLSVGVVAENVRPNGQFVTSDVLVQDQSTIDRIDSDGPDALVELSCGYEVDLDRTPGTTPEGERYDAVQTNIRYNHVGLGPSNWGRAGAQVKLHLDGGLENEAGALRLDSAGDVDLAHYSSPMSMTAEEKARLDRAEAERDTFKSENDKNKARADAAEAELAREKAQSGKLIDPSTVPALVAARAQLENSARAILGPEFTATKKDGDKTVPMTDAEIVAAALAKHDPNFKADGRSSDYLRARFDAVVEQSAKVDGAHRELGAAIVDTARTGGTPEKSRLDQALEKSAEDARKAAQGGPPPGAMTRKP